MGNPSPFSTGLQEGIRLAVPLIMQQNRLKAAETEFQSRMAIESAKLKILEDQAAEELATKKLQDELFRVWGNIEEGQYSGVRSGKTPSTIPLTEAERRVIPKQTPSQLASFGFTPEMVTNIQQLQDPYGELRAKEALKKPTTLEAVIAQRVSPEEALRIKMALKGEKGTKLYETTKGWLPPSQAIGLGKPGKTPTPESPGTALRRKKDIAEVHNTILGNKDNKNITSYFTAFNTSNENNEVAYWDSQSWDEEAKIIKLPKEAINQGWTPTKIQQAADKKGITVEEVLRRIGIIK